ncbi:MAG: hypothetical protein ACK58Q_12570 [Chitinophagales bacterium]|jgi:hypothetical protein
MRQILIYEICNEKPNSAALGAYNASLSSAGGAAPQSLLTGFNALSSSNKKGLEYNSPQIDGVKVTVMENLVRASKSDTMKQIEGFQRVEVEYSFFGNKRSDIFDTKVMRGGAVFVIDGNGFIKSGTRIR